MDHRRNYGATMVSVLRTILFGFLVSTKDLLNFRWDRLDKARKRQMPFTIPVELVNYDGRKYMAAMTFEHSMQREFALTVSKKALQECNDKEKLREVALNLLEGWAMMNTAVQGLMKENIELRQAINLRDSSLEAADVLLTEAGEALKKYERQSSRAKWRLWPFAR